MKPAIRMGLRHIFGDKPIPKIIDFLLVHRSWEVGKAKLYALDFESPSVKKLDEFALAADIEFAEKVEKHRHLFMAQR